MTLALLVLGGVLLLFCVFYGPEVWWYLAQLPVILSNTWHNFKIWVEEHRPI